MKKNYMLALVGAITLVVGFGVGYMIHQPQNAPAGLGGGSFAGAGRRNAVGGSGNTFVDGQIIAMDSTSLTLQLRNGSSQIVFYATSTPVSKMVSGSMSDLSLQKDVTIIGTKNPDGSVTAQSVQVRPAGASPIGR